jgi:hypothetical protein
MLFGSETYGDILSCDALEHQRWKQYVPLKQ